MQGGKARWARVLGLGFVLWSSVVRTVEGIAIAGLLAPALLALIVSDCRFALASAGAGGLGSVRALIGYLAGLTGGLQSPLMVWLVLVPAEAALAGGRRAVMRAGFSAALVLLAVAAIEILGRLPPSRLPLPADVIAGVALLAALAQAGLIAAAARDQKRTADRAAEQGAAMYQLLAENAVDLITRHAPDGRIRFASPASHTLLGRTPSELEGALPAVLTHPDDLAARAGGLHGIRLFRPRRRRRGAASPWREGLCLGRDTLPPGGPADQRRAVRNRGGDPRCFRTQGAGACPDRGARRGNERIARQIRFPGQYESRIAHALERDIGFSELMTREIFGPVGNARYQEYAKLIHDFGGHLLDLINGVLDMSKIEAGKFELYEEIFELDDLASASLRFVNLAAERGGVALGSEIAPGARRIFADKRAVKQILVNLLSNGVKFTPRGGQVMLSARLGEKGVEIMVRDTGTGISKSDLEKLGKPFEQVESAVTRGKEGTGLGLALVKSLAAMHGGDAMLESVLGVGTVVKVRLPFAAVDADGSRLKAEAKILPFRGAA